MSTVINGSSPSITFSDGTVQSTAANITAPYTSNGVVYASSTTALATGSNLKFNGTNLGLGGSLNANWDTVNYNALQIGVNGSLISTSANNNYIYVAANAYLNGGFKYISTNANAVSAYAQSNGTHVWYTAPSGTADNAISFTQAMTLNTSGNLAVNGTITSGTTGTNGSVIVCRSSDGAGVGNFSFDGSNVFTNDGLGNGLVFKIASSEKARIDGSGNLCIGTTSAGGYKLNVTASGSYGAQFVTNTGNISAVFSNTGSGSQSLQYFYVNGSNVGSITYNGSLVLYNQTSDQRLKENIVDAPEGNIDQIKIKSFDWKSNGTHNTYGVIAQELLEVAPYAVHVPSDPDEMMGVDYSKLVPMMIKEIQSLKQRILTLENK